jgi:hypothetical protein
VAAPAPDEVYRAVSRIFALIVVGFGLAIIVVTLVNGGGVASYGLVIGVLFTLLGAGRVYLSFRRAGGD